MNVNSIISRATRKKGVRRPNENGLEYQCLTGGSSEISALDDCLGLVQAVNLQLAVCHARVEVHGDEVAPWGDLPEEVEGGVEVVLIRRALGLFCGHGLLLARDFTLEIGLGAFELRDRIVDLAIEGLLRSSLLAVGLLNILLDVGLDQGEDIEDPRGFTIRFLVGVRFPGIR